MSGNQQKTALITGITGQDGAYLSDFLLSKGYDVHGLQRRSSTPNIERLNGQIEKGLKLHYGDITDGAGLARLIDKIQPEEIYNFAAQSYVHVSFDIPEYTAHTDGLGALKILEAIRILGMEKKTKLLQASSSELFGKVSEPIQSEKTPFYPRSPYAVAKLYAYWMAVNYREAYGIFASNAIMFNHESPIRGEEFVTRKVTLAAANIADGRQECLYLGNLDAKRDWSHASDMVRGAWQILQHDVPDDFVLASGVNYTVREWATLSFAELGMMIEWSGEGVNEIGVDKVTGKTLVRVDPAHFRPTEVDTLCGDATKVKESLGWSPTVSFSDLIKEMVWADMDKINPDFKKVRCCA